MNIRNLFILLLFGCTICFAQKIHSPAEITKLMMDSKVNYSISSPAEGTIFKDTVDYSSRLVPGFIFQTNENGGRQIRQYRITGDLESVIQEAETAFHDKRLATAREKYQQVLEKVPDCSNLMDFIGQTYEDEKDYNHAEEWYKKAVEANPIDYMAHWFLSTMYTYAGHGDPVEEIITALTLNRNNPRLLEHMRSEFQRMGLVWDDWHFTPQYDLWKDNDTIKIRPYSVDWLGYALAKAAWQYEPGYRPSSKPGDSIGFSSNAELEAMLMIYTRETLDTLAESEKSKDVGIQNMVKSIKDKNEISFIYFELFLRQVPLIAATLPPETIHDIVKYAREMHVRKL